MSELRAFDPSRHLTLVSGKEYLEVRWRLVWLRSEHPDAIIDTELISHQGNEAVFKAYVKIPDGGSATGYGSEDSQGFGDYLEKAETKAIGRALAALGYGTQFSHDHDFGAAQGRVVDAPTQFRNVGTNAPQQASQAQQRAPGGYDTAATDRQTSLITSLARDLKLSRQDLDATAQELTGSPFDGLTRKNASTLIESLKERTTRGVPV
jgi:hypothetical protein